MTQILTDSGLVIAQRLQVLLDAAKVTLGIADVWFGDQTLLPHTPALCIEPGRKQRLLKGIPDLTQNSIDTSLLLYHSAISETQANRVQAIQTAEAVERFLHINHFNLQNAAGDQIVVYGFITDMDPGYAYKNTGTLYSAVQMTWSALTKTSVRNPPS
jgi:hypothetical protein